MGARLRKDYEGEEWVIIPQNGLRFFGDFLVIRMFLIFGFVGVFGVEAITVWLNVQDVILGQQND
jgi:hypothetical protein